MSGAKANDAPTGSARRWLPERAAQRLDGLLASVLLRSPVVVRALDACLGAITRYRAPSGPRPPLLVVGNAWWFPLEHVPTQAGGELHPYFEPGDGQALAASLNESHGRRAVLSAGHFRLVVLDTAWSGLEVTSRDRRLSRELTSGTMGAPVRQRLRSTPVMHVADAVVALQRNDTNYGHFITEVLPSILAWERASAVRPTLAVAESSFSIPLLRLVGYEGAIVPIPKPAIVIGHNVDVLRLLPAGTYHRDLLHEVARRASAAVGPGRSVRSPVVFLSRTRDANRLLTNEAEVIATLRQRFPELDVFYSGTATVEEQIQRMGAADIVISTYGAQAMNMVWATKMRRFVEISFYTRSEFQALARTLGASGHGVSSRAVNAGDHYTDHECDIANLDAVLRTL